MARFTGLGISLRVGPQSKPFNWLLRRGLAGTKANIQSYLLVYNILCGLRNTTACCLCFIPQNLSRTTVKRRSSTSRTARSDKRLRKSAENVDCYNYSICRMRVTKPYCLVSTRFLQR